MARFKLWVAFLAVLLAGGCSKSGSGRETRKESTYKGPPVSLQAKFTPGLYSLDEDLDLKMDIRVGGQNVDMNMGIALGGDVGISPPDAASQEQEVKFTCRRVKCSVSAMGQKGQFDSEKRNSGGGSDAMDRALASSLGEMVGWKGVVIAKGSKIIRIQEGLESLMAAVSSSSAMPPSQAMQFRNQMKEFLEELLIKHWGAAMPTKPVSPGDKWRAEIKVSSAPMLGALKVAADCELEDIEQTAQGQEAVIRAVVSMSVPSKKLDTTEMGGPAIPTTLENLICRVTVTFRFNLDIGLATDAKMNGTITGDMSIEAMRGKTQRASFTADMRYTNRLRKAG